MEVGWQCCILITFIIFITLLFLLLLSFFITFIIFHYFYYFLLLYYFYYFMFDFLSLLFCFSVFCFIVLFYVLLCFQPFFISCIYVQPQANAYIYLNAVKVTGEMRLSWHCQNCSRDDHAQLKLGLENKKEKTIDIQLRSYKGVYIQVYTKGSSRTSTVVIYIGSAGHTGFHVGQLLSLPCLAKCEMILLQLDD